LIAVSSYALPPSTPKARRSDITVRLAVQPRSQPNSPRRHHQCL